MASLTVWGRSSVTLLVTGLAGCVGGIEVEGQLETSSLQRDALETVSLFITEVAQSAPGQLGMAGGTSSADRVEVFCSSAAGCSAYKVCDSSAGGAACSALQPALASKQRATVSRGSNITTSDQVWLADASGLELAGTRVGPFDCGPGLSRARSDCSIAPFSACGTPGLGNSSGSCSNGSFPEPFAYSLYFTTNQHGAPESSCNRAACQALLSAIRAAHSSISFAIYGVRAQPDIIAALVAARDRGVAIRGVVDAEDSACTRFGYSDTAALIAALGGDRVHCDTGPGYSYIMHNKFFVFDEASVWTGSTNISDTELGGEYNSDVAALIGSYKLAEIYQAEFDELWSGLCHNRKSDNTEHVVDGSHFSDGTLLRSYFSPTDRAVENAVIPLIAGATQTLDVAMFYFTNQTIADALIAARARGVTVRMVLDASGAANSASKHGQLCANGIAVKTENWGGKSHSKWAVADAAHPAAAAVVFGSMNWTGAGDAQNDENTLYVRNSGLAASFALEFARQWADLASVPTCTAVSVEGSDSSRCTPSDDCSRACSSGSCCDGVDNDYDGQIDLQEEACGCADGVDNDRDGYLDGDDYDCKNLVDP